MEVPLSGKSRVPTPRGRMLVKKPLYIPPTQEEYEALQAKLVEYAKISVSASDNFDEMKKAYDELLQENEQIVQDNEKLRGASECEINYERLKNEEMELKASCSQLESDRDALKLSLTAAIARRGLILSELKKLREQHRQKMEEYSTLLTRTGKDLLDMVEKERVADVKDDEKLAAELVRINREQK